MDGPNNSLRLHQFGIQQIPATPLKPQWAFFLVLTPRNRPVPTYTSQRVSGSDQCAALGNPPQARRCFSDLFGEPFKPKWMRRRTFQRYLDRDNELAAREMPYLTCFLALEEATLVRKKRG